MSSLSSQSQMEKTMTSHMWLCADKLIFFIFQFFLFVSWVARVSDQWWGGIRYVMIQDPKERGSPTYITHISIIADKYLAQLISLFHVLPWWRLWRRVVIDTAPSWLHCSRLANHKPKLKVTKSSRLKPRQINSQTMDTKDRVSKDFKPVDNRFKRQLKLSTTNQT